MYVCLCRAVTDSAVRKLGRAGVIDADDLIERLRLEDKEACGYCARHIEQIVAIATEAYTANGNNGEHREGATA
jgi:bacterioferritin-associated ferredoxin